MINTIKQRLGVDVPTAPAPVTISESQMQELGTLRGRSWFTTPVDVDHEYELRSDQRYLRDANPAARLSDGELYVAGSVDFTDDATGRTWSELVWYQTRRYPLGSFAAGGRNPKTAPAPRPARGTAAVDGLVLLPALAPRTGSIVSYAHERVEDVVPLPPGVEVIAGPRSTPLGATFTSDRGPVRGPDAILEVLKGKRGATSVVPCRYGCHVVVETERGALDPGARDLVDAAAPLLAPAVGCTRSPLADVIANGHCHHPRHPGDERPVAVTIGPGGVYGSPLCADCLRPPARGVAAREAVA